MSEWETCNFEKVDVLELKLLLANLNSMRLQLMLLNKDIPVLQARAEAMEKALLDKASENGKYELDIKTADFENLVISRKLKEEIIE